MARKKKSENPAALAALLRIAADTLSTDIPEAIPDEFHDAARAEIKSLESLIDAARDLQGAAGSAVARYRMLITPAPARAVGMAPEPPADVTVTVAGIPCVPDASPAAGRYYVQRLVPALMLPECAAVPEAELLEGLRAFLAELPDGVEPDPVPGVVFARAHT